MCVEDNGDDENESTDRGKGKGQVLAAYMNQTRVHKRFTISEVA